MKYNVCRAQTLHFHHILLPWQCCYIDVYFLYLMFYKLIYLLHVLPQVYISYKMIILLKHADIYLGLEFKLM